jgi:hypothetical protein
MKALSLGDRGCAVAVEHHLDRLAAKLIGESTTL